MSHYNVGDADTSGSYEAMAEKWLTMYRMRQGNPRKLFNNRECITKYRECKDRASELRKDGK